VAENGRISSKKGKCDLSTSWQ